jgi:hypothetical protein
VTRREAFELVPTHVLYSAVSRVTLNGQHFHITNEGRRGPSGSRMRYIVQLAMTLRYQLVSKTLTPGRWQIIKPTGQQLTLS